jgi:hypothetical protein
MAALINVRVNIIFFLYCSVHMQLSPPTTNNSGTSVPILEVMYGFTSAVALEVTISDHAILKRL